MPASSAIGMNSAGDTAPSSRLSQRIRASNPVSRPVASSNCGWYTTSSSWSWSAKRSWRSRPSRRACRSRSAWSVNVKLFLPPVLTAYIAVSALFVSVATSWPSRGNKAMPTEAETFSDLPSISNGEARRLQSLPATTPAAAASLTPPSATTNSSPPKRATRSRSRTFSRSTSAMAISRRSPVA